MHRMVRSSKVQVESWNDGESILLRSVTPLCGWSPRSPEFPEPSDECDESLASVPNEDEVRDAVEYIVEEQKGPR